MVWRELDAASFNQLPKKVVIDVRSPCEFKKESIPDALNVPLLSDEERAEVGTIYKHDGEFKARNLALGMVSPKIPEITDKIIHSKKDNHTLVVYCWRGGLRSEAVASFLSLLGIDCWRLTGGYKAWRRCLLDDFENDQYNFETIILDGLTGVGKTEVLKQLTLLGQQTLDLEGLANHRGSTFGGIGMSEQPSQKNYDAQLWSALRKFGAGPLFLEAESRKVGNLSLPHFLFDRIKSSTRILLKASLESRIERIAADYEIDLHCGAFKKQLDGSRTIKERLGNEKYTQLSDYLQCGRLTEFIEVMLTDYYDPLYMRHIEKCSNYELTVNSDNALEAASKIHNWVQSQRSKIA